MLNKIFVSPFNGQKYTLYYCGNCTAGFWDPMKIIPEFYESASIDIYRDMHRGLKSPPRHCLKFFRRMPIATGNLLDIGCGDGIFLNKVAESKTLDFKVYGLDFDANSVATAKKKYGIDNIYSQSLEQFGCFALENDTRFNVVTFFDVLEHQDNPKSFIKDAMKLLSPGGYVAGSVPNANRLFSRHDRKNSQVDFPPHHFIYFNERSLKTFLAGEGFTDIRIEPVTLGLADMIALMENICLGDLSKVIRGKVMKGSPGCSGAASSATGMENQSVKTRIFKTIRNILFAPLALVAILPYNRRGPQLYFQARRPN